jgi:hypothetical protein
LSHLETGRSAFWLNDGNLDRSFPSRKQPKDVRAKVGLRGNGRAGMLEVRDANYRIIGYVDGTQIRDADRRIIGNLDGDEVRDQDFRLIGKVSGKEVRDTNFRLIGSLDGDKIRESNYNISVAYSGKQSTLKGEAALFLLLCSKAA